MHPPGTCALFSSVKMINNCAHSIMPNAVVFTYLLCALFFSVLTLKCFQKAKQKYNTSTIQVSISNTKIITVKLDMVSAQLPWKPKSMQATQSRQAMLVWALAWHCVVGREATQSRQAMLVWALAWHCVVGRDLDLYRILRCKYDLLFI